MGIFENRSLVSSDRLKRLLLFVLFLLSGLMLLVGCHEDQEEEVISSIYNEDDLKYEDSLKQYLRNTYPSVINKVSVTESSIEIVGNCVGEGHFYLGEIPPYLDVTKIDYTIEKKILFLFFLFIFFVLNIYRYHKNYPNFIHFSNH